MKGNMLAGAARAFLGRRSRCAAGGDGMRNTAPKSTVPRGDAGEGRA